MSRRARLRICALPMRRLVMTPSRDGVSGERFCQLAKIQPLAKRVASLPVGPEIRAGLDSAELGKSRELAGGRHSCQKGRQTTVSRARPRARRPAKILRPALVAMSARKPCLRLRLIFDGWNVCFI